MAGIPSGGSPRYTGRAERAVGGITDGQEFDAVPLDEMWDLLIRQEKFPALTSPSSTFGSSHTGLREVGALLDLTFNAAFSRGSISPQYTAASPFRSGVPVAYHYEGTGLPPVVTKSDLTDIQAVLGVTVALGVQTWRGRVEHEAGVQPKSSYDNDYNSPYPAGFTAWLARQITGVYPYRATTVTIDELTGQPLSPHTSTYVDTAMVAESGGDRQRAAFPTAWSPIIGVQWWNPVSSQWEWLGGSAVASLGFWTVTSVQYEVQGVMVDYELWTHNGATVGARSLRWRTA